MARRRGASGRPVLTGRALVLGALVVLLVVLLAPPIHRFLRSRSDIGAAAAQLQTDRASLHSLAAQRDRWGDPGYIQRQARARLQFAMPGDTVYVVVDKGQRSNLAKTAGAGARKAVAQAWNTRLWDSVRAVAG